MQPNFNQPDKSTASEKKQTSDDRKTWLNLTKNLLARVSSSPLYHESYVTSVQWVINQPSTPDISSINKWLEPTGWRAEQADGYVPIKEYQALQSRRVFPIAKSLRSLDKLEHSAAPDLFHDIAGHLPLLFNEEYSQLVEIWATLSLDAPLDKADVNLSIALQNLIDARENDAAEPELNSLTEALTIAQAEARLNASRSFRFQNFYTWAIEFGVIGPEDNFKIIGGAALSSAGEITNIINGQTTITRFDDTTIDTPVDYTTYQKRLFRANSFSEYINVLNSI